MIFMLNLSSLIMPAPLTVLQVSTLYMAQLKTNWHFFLFLTQDSLLDNKKSIQAVNKF